MKKILLLLILIWPEICSASDREKIIADSLFRSIETVTGNRDKCRIGCEAFDYLTAYNRDSTLLESVYHVLLENQFSAENRGDSVIMAKVLNTLGNYYYINRDFEDAIVCLKTAALYYTSLENHAGLCDCYRMIASSLYWSNYNKAAIEYLYKSIKIAESLNDSNIIASAYFNLGMYLMYDDQPRKSIEAFIKRTLDSDNNMRSCYIAQNHLLLGNTDSAQYFLNKCEKLATSSFVYHPPYYFRTKAAYFQQTGNVDSAMYYYNQAISGFQTAVQNHHIPNCYYQLGKLYLLKGNETAGAANLEKAVSTGREFLRHKIIIKACQALSGFYEAKNNLALAFQYLKTVAVYQDSIKTNEINDLISVQNMQLELTSKEEALGQLRVMNELENRHLMSRQKWIMNTSIGAIVCISLISGILWRSRNMNRKANRHLSKTLVDLKNAQEQLIQQEKLASLGSLTAGIAHEIKNPLNFVNNFSLLSSDLIHEFLNSTDESERNEIAADLKVNLEKICEHGMRADSIVRTMLQHSRGSTTEKQKVDLNLLCEEYLNLAYHGKRASDANFSCKLEFIPAQDLPTIRADAQDISRVILNIVTNAMDEISSLPGGTVSVATERNESNVYVKIKDNGGGIPEEISEKIFEPFFTTKPTGKGTGLGLSLSNEIIKAHGGSIKINSKRYSGTEFCIALPL